MSKNQKKVALIGLFLSVSTVLLALAVVFLFKNHEWLLGSFSASVLFLCMTAIPFGMLYMYTNPEEDEPQADKEELS